MWKKWILHWSPVNFRFIMNGKCGGIQPFDQTLSADHKPKSFISHLLSRLLIAKCDVILLMFIIFINYVPLQSIEQIARRDFMRMDVKQCRNNLIKM